MSHATTAAPATPAAPVAGSLVLPRRRRLVRSLAALVAAGAGTAGFLLAADDASGEGATTAAPRVYLSVQSEDRREWAVCEHGPCPTVPGVATPRREQVHRTRSITFVWSSPVRAATTPAAASPAEPPDDAPPR